MSVSLIMVCASCRAALAEFTKAPTSPDWQQCLVKSLIPGWQPIPGSTQICPVCGKYMLLQDEQIPCEKCGKPDEVPPGGVSTNQGTLREVITRAAPKKARSI